MAFMIPAAIQAGLQIAQGAAQSGAMKDAAAAMNAEAKSVRQAGAADEDTLRRNQRMEMGRIRATAAEGGFDPSSGSLAKLQSKSAAEMELDALTSRYRTELKAVGLENDARMMWANAKAARRTANLSAFGTLASSGANYFGAPRIGPPAPVVNRDIPRGR